MKKITTSKHLQGTTELTMIIPVKQGFIQSLDTRTYATRLRLLMRALNGLRQSSREVSTTKPISDTVERIQTIQSFRLSMLDNDTKIMLAVAFDGAWETYIRVIWKDLGALLDVIMCNSEDYPSAIDHSFERYVSWIRQYQVESQFFYTATALTAADYHYLRDSERNDRETHDALERDKRATLYTIKDTDKIARQVAAKNPQELLRQSLKALAVLDGLRDLYPDGTQDGIYLLRASHELLREFKRFDTRHLLPAAVRSQYLPQLEWFEQPLNLRKKPAIEHRAIGNNAIQAGILQSYENITHGALLLIRILDPIKARDFLSNLPITTHSTDASRNTMATNTIAINLAFTLQGLKHLGLTAQDIAKFPKEFQEGMEARAGLLGDEQLNHPSQWRLPQQNWPSEQLSRRVPLSSVDFVLQLRTEQCTEQCTEQQYSNPQSNRDSHRITENPEHPLYQQVQTIAESAGIELLSVEAMASYERGHFGFVDGISQPQPCPSQTKLTENDHQDSKRYWSDQVATGEILMGHQNDRDNITLDEAAVDPLLDNGTFLVVRKIRQHVDALNEFLAEQHDTLTTHNLSSDDLKAKMMGRAPDGTPLVPHSDLNDFNFDTDPDGIQCPLHSHIRRCNPRNPTDNPINKGPMPRIARRGMSYGPPHCPNATSDKTERGLMFLAYNANIAEQFEVIQRWVSGGNSSGTYSGQSDPFLGVARTGEKRTLRYLVNDQVLRFDLDPSADQKRPLTQLEWGAYLFVPSMDALALILQKAPLPETPDTAQQQLGETWIKTLQAIEKDQGKDIAFTAWKTALEDVSAKAAGISSGVWSAIRANHGVLRTPYGILVAREDLVTEVLTNDAVYSVSGYAERMQQSLGHIYLGMDKGQDYSAAADQTNAAIGQISTAEAFDIAREKTHERLQQLKQLSTANSPVTISLRWLADQVLADLSQYWFDIPDGKHVLAGGKPGPDSHTVHCPHHFTAPSRYIFSPNPTEFAAGLGQSYGKQILQASQQFVNDLREQGHSPQGQLAAAMFSSIDDNKQLAHTLVGALMGFLPTVYGNFLSSLYQWTQFDHLQRLQQDLHCVSANHDFASASSLLKTPLMQAMQTRPVPDMIWRTTTQITKLGNLELHGQEQGKTVPDRVVIGIAAVTQAYLAEHRLDVSPIFGGRRGFEGQQGQEQSCQQASQNKHPTHACPGYAMAMGVLLGMITALLEGRSLKTTGIPLVLEQ